MNCSICGGEMSEGVLESGRYIQWNALNENGKKEKYLLAKSYMGGATLDGFFCPHCRKLVLGVPHLD